MIVNSIWPGLVAVVLGVATVAVFRKDLGVARWKGSVGEQVGSFAWFILTRLLALVLVLLVFSVAIFFPVLASGDGKRDDFDPMVGVNLTNVSVLLVVVLFAIAQFAYGKVYGARGGPGDSGWIFLNPIFKP